MDELKIEPDDYEFTDSEKDEAPFEAKQIEQPLPKMKRGAPAEENAEENLYNYPDPSTCSHPPVVSEADLDSEGDLKKAKLLEETLRSFGIQTKLTGIAHGPAVTRFELQPAPGVKVSRITALADDIALNLAAIRVRIEAPIPGKAAVGVEVPNDKVENRAPCAACSKVPRHAGIPPAWRSASARTLRPVHRRGYRENAARADRGANRIGQVRVHQRDHRLDPLPARRPRRSR